MYKKSSQTRKYKFHNLRPYMTSRNKFGISVWLLTCIINNELAQDCIFPLLNPLDRKSKSNEADEEFFSQAGLFFSTDSSERDEDRERRKEKSWEKEKTPKRQNGHVRIIGMRTKKTTTKKKKDLEKFRILETFVSLSLCSFFLVKKKMAKKSSC